jgi:hypothetical protein
MNDLFDPSPPAGVAPTKWARLVAFLGALPTAPAQRLFAALEKDAAPRPGFPAPAILATLRTRLIEEGGSFPPRPLTAQRLFFAPFEDFFVAVRHGRKRRARIARSSIAPIWTLLLTDASLAEAARAAAGLDAAIRQGGDVAAREDALFRTAADGLERLIALADSDAAFREDLSSRLSGGDPQRGAAALLDLAEIAALLPAVAHLREAQGEFPRPTRSLTEEDVYSVRRLYARAAADQPETAAYVLFAVAARMDAPWRALRLAFHLARIDSAHLKEARADAAALVEILFEDVESLARGLERDAEEGDPETEELPARFTHFAEFAKGAAEEAARARDGAAERRVEACRDIAAAALARACEKALAAVRAVHPVRRAGGSSRLMAMRPDVARPVERGAERAAVAGAAFLARAGGLAAALGRTEAAAPIAESALAETRRYAGDLILEIRAAEGGERDAARRRMEATLRAAAPLLPADEIALLKERAAAAAVSA